MVHPTLSHCLVAQNTNYNDNREKPEIRLSDEIRLSLRKALSRKCSSTQTN